MSDCDWNYQGNPLLPVANAFLGLFATDFKVHTGVPYRYRHLVTDGKIYLLQ